MRKALLALALVSCAPLASCATLQGTATTVTVNVDKGYLTAIGAFIEYKRLAIAGIQAGVITGSTKARAIDLANRGQVIEDRLYTARTAVDVQALTDIAAELAGITGKK